MTTTMAPVDHHTTCLLYPTFPQVLAGVCCLTPFLLSALFTCYFQRQPFLSAKKKQVRQHVPFPYRAHVFSTALAGLDVSRDAGPFDLGCGGRLAPLLGVGFCLDDAAELGRGASLVAAFLCVGFICLGASVASELARGGALSFVCVEFCCLEEFKAGGMVCGREPVSLFCVVGWLAVCDGATAPMLLRGRSRCSSVRRSLGAGASIELERGRASVPRFCLGGGLSVAGELDRG